MCWFEPGALGLQQKQEPWDHNLSYYICTKYVSLEIETRPPSPNTADGLGADSEGVLKLVELEAAVLGRGELKEKDCGAEVSNAENL